MDASLCLAVAFASAGKAQIETRRIPGPLSKGASGSLLIVTALFGGLIAYTGIPYHGKLAWKIQSLQNHRTIKFVHSNFYEDGIRGMLEDVRKAVSLPEELYLADNLTVIFQADGTITDIETMLCGQDTSGKIRTFLLSYNAEHSDKLDVWINRGTDFSLDGEKALSPLLCFLMPQIIEVKWKRGTL